MVKIKECHILFEPVILAKQVLLTSLCLNETYRHTLISTCLSHTLPELKSVWFLAIYFKLCSGLCNFKKPSNTGEN